MKKTEFSIRMKNLRNNKKLSMSELAKILGVSKSSINMWENGSSIPKQEILIRISREFDVSIDYLLGNEQMEGKEPENQRLKYLQRNLRRMDEEKLKKTEAVLKSIFDDLFEEVEDTEI